MKSDSLVDEIMRRIPEKSRNHWCDKIPENGCVCSGCVQINNLALVANHLIGGPFSGDPESISRDAFMEHPELVDALVLTKEEWEAWKARQNLLG
jgi:hypothetical protein